MPWAMTWSSAVLLRVAGLQCLHVDLQLVMLKHCLGFGLLEPAGLMCLVTIVQTGVGWVGIILHQALHAIILLHEQFRYLSLHWCGVKHLNGGNGCAKLERLV